MEGRGRKKSGNYWLSAQLKDEWDLISRTKAENMSVGHLTSSSGLYMGSRTSRPNICRCTRVCVHTLTYIHTTFYNLI